MRTVLGDLTGAVADLGIFVPLVAALVLVNYLDAGAILLAAGALVLASGALFRIPFPVQPLKALAAVAIAQKLAPDVIHAAGLEIAACLFVLSIGGIADAISRLFTKPVVRAVQFGVGLLLVFTAFRLAVHPPPAFQGASLLLSAVALILIVLVVWQERYEIALLLFVVAIAAVWLSAAPAVHGPTLSAPSLIIPHGSAFASAFFLLVIPQLPLTFGNAVVAVTDVAHSYFPDSVRRVTPTRVCLSCGAGNVVSALVGGMPMCHGAGGLTAHARLGARTARMNLVLGSAFVVLGLFFGRQIPALLALLPVWLLSAFLAYAGVRHALLAADQRGWPLLLALGAGTVGAWRGNLALTVAIALLGAHAHRLRRVSVGARS